MVELMEVFKDFEIIIKGGSFHGRYQYPMRVTKKDDPPRLSFEDLVEYVEHLKSKYPEKGFKLVKRRVEGREYYVIAKKAHWVDEAGRLREHMDRVPIYIDLEGQRFFVPKRYLRDRRRLVNYIVMRALGALGVSQTTSRV